MCQGKTEQISPLYPEKFGFFSHFSPIFQPVPLKIGHPTPFKVTALNWS